MLANTKEDDGSVRRSNTVVQFSKASMVEYIINSRGDGASTLCMSIHLCHNDGTEISAFFERLTLGFRSLAYHSSY